MSKAGSFGQNKVCVSGVEKKNIPIYDIPTSFVAYVRAKKAVCFKEATHFERGQILNLSRRFEWENGSVFENSLSRDVLHFPQQNTINTKRYQKRGEKNKAHIYGKMYLKCAHPINV